MTMTNTLPVPRPRPAGPAAAAAALVRLTDACRHLGECHSIPEVKQLRDQAAVLAAYLRGRREALDVQNKVTESRLRCDRRLGQLLADTERHRGGNPNLSRPRRVDPPTLEEQGLTRSVSSRCQMIASVPDKDFEHHLAASREPGGELTTAGVLHLARTLDIRARHDRRRQQAHEFAQANPDAGRIITGDLGVLADHLADDTAAMFLTDLPYNLDALPLFGRLGDLAARKLKPGGFCLTYTGRLYLDKVMAQLGRHLNYFWMIAVRLHARGPSLCRRRIWQRWAAVLVYQKPPATPPPTWFEDMLDGAGREKDLHPHQQAELEAAALIETFSNPGDLVIDPACGCGTVLAAAKAAGRRWLGCEVNPDTAALARQRLAAR
jgi:hypothetical protein